MKHRLSRVLHIRTFLEELAQLELEQKNVELLRLEQAAEQQRRMALAVRVDVLHALVGSSEAGSWLTGIADGEIVKWKSGKLDALAVVSRLGAERARGLLLECRLRRRQLEILLATAAQRESQEQTRREQTRVDDWFHSRAALRNRKAE
jgi:hypothetical protein